MKKTITFLTMSLIGLCLSAQNYGVNLDYMMLSGTMVTDSNGDAVTYLNDADTTEVGAGAIVLGVYYTYDISEKMNVSASVGYGLGFGIMPMKAKFNYGITDKINANLGVGMYMITDDGYSPVESPEDSDDSWKGSSNEFGVSMGVSYAVMNSLGVSVGYEMIKGGDHSSLNAMTVGLTYGFGGKSSDNE